METERLRQLEAISRLGSLSAAADELGFTQPTLSRSVRRLESDLGCELFTRTRNSMRLNERGRIVVEYAREILRTEQNMRRDLEALGGTMSSVSVGTCAPAPLWRITSALVTVRPGIMIAPKLMTEDQVERAIFSGDVDVAVTLRPLNLPSCESIPFMHEDLLLYVPEDDPLAGREEVSFSDMADRTFLVYADIGFWWDVCKQNLPRAKFIRQHDRVVFQELARTSKALLFATVSAGIEPFSGRVTVPISDEDAHASFYVSVSTGLGEELTAAIRDAASF
jgi:LysR family cyn operon transcriptional activator